MTRSPGAYIDKRCPQPEYQLAIFFYTRHGIDAAFRSFLQKINFGQTSFFLFIACDDPRGCLSLFEMNISLIFKRHKFIY